MKITIGVFFGGRSVEHEISVISAIQAINAIDKQKYSVFPVYITKEGHWYTGDSLLEIDNYKNIDSLLNKSTKISISNHYDDFTVFEDRKKLFGRKQLAKIDVAIPILHGTYGEDGCLQGLFEMKGLPYAGCNVLASANGMDKIAMKMILKESALPVVDYIWFYFNEWISEPIKVKRKVVGLGFPVIVKPANLGSSVGISKAENESELEEAIEYAGSFTDRILIEQIVPNLREINCAVLGDYEEAIASPCEEPMRSGSFLSYADKYVSNGAKNEGKGGMTNLKRKLPAEIRDELAIKIQDLAVKTFRVLNCAGTSRIDFLLDNETNQVYVNEINTIPGSLSFYLWEAGGIKFQQLMTRLVEIALKQYREKNKLIVNYQTNIFNIKTDSIKLGKG